MTSCYYQLLLHNRCTNFNNYNTDSYGIFGRKRNTKCRVPITFFKRYLDTCITVILENTDL